MVSTTSSIHHGLCLCYLCTAAAASSTANNPNVNNNDSSNNENLNKVSNKDTHNRVRRELEGEAPFVDLYVPTNNVDGVANIDLDIQSVWSKVLLGDSVSIAAARDVYAGGVGDVSLESIGSSSELVDPNIIQEYSGDYDYYNRLMQAVFDKVSTSFVNSGIDFDFSGFSKDENAGACFSCLLWVCWRLLLLLNELVLWCIYFVYVFIERVCPAWDARCCHGSYQILS